MTTETTVTTHEIPAANLDALARRLTTLGNRATKLGIAPVVFSVTERFTKLVSITDTALTHFDCADGVFALNPGAPDAATTAVPYVRVTVSGEVPRLQDWRFVATLHHMEGTTIALGARCEVPAGTTDRGPTCEHCALRRERRDTYLLQHADGRWLQVGKTCLEQFFQDASAARIARMAEYLADVDGALANGSDWCGTVGREKGKSLIVFLMHVAQAQRVHGWVSKGEAFERKLVSTCERAEDSLNRLWQTESGGTPYTPYEKPMLCDAMAATGAINWALDLEPGDNDYLRNMRTIAQASVVDSRLAGIAASMLTAQENERKRIEREAAKARAAELDKASQFVGTVGQREVFVVTIERVIDCGEGQFGQSYLYLMRDAAGNCLKWFSTGEGLEEGKAYTIKGTVKSHEEYKGTKQTMLSRCAEYVPPAPKVAKPRKPRATKASGAAA